MYSDLTYFSNYHIFISKNTIFQPGLFQILFFKTWHFSRMSVHFYYPYRAIFKDYFWSETILFLVIITTFPFENI